MRRTVWHRILSAVCALWLATALAEPAALHACAMHGGHGGPPGHAMATHAAAHGKGGHSPGQHERAQCTCMGACCPAAVVAAPSATHELTLAVVARYAPVHVHGTSVERPAAPEYSRPPTIGPPQLTG